jgi:signal transduction histidine kinase
MACARLVHKELPLRFATRIKQIESSSDQWRDIPDMQRIHQMFSESFRKLRLVELEENETESCSEEFMAVVQDIKARHLPAVPWFRDCASALRERGLLDDDQVNEWLFRIFNSRMGTEMLTWHYEALATDTDESHVGIVHTRCDPHEVCADAIASVQRQFSDSGLDIVGISLGPKDHQDYMACSFIPTYLFFIVEELLKNSVCASLARAKQTGGDVDGINVIIRADAKRVAVKISDYAGGVPFEHGDRIWEYMFSTTAQGLKPRSCEATPLSGHGMGLPLCRLYTTYLGGSLHLMSMPGVGTDTFIYFNRLEVSDSWTSIAEP